MCRWAAWLGEPLFISEILSAPAHSLIHQSREASKCKTAINADGFGLAWYGDHAQPGLYRDVYPAWSDPNLRSIAQQVRSRLFLAHVRASTCTATSRNNCHPFVQDRWAFMHNGQIGGFEAYRRQAEALITDDLYPHRKGATDSEVLFLLACRLGIESDPQTAMAQAVGLLEAIWQRRVGQAPHMRCTAAFTDWHGALCGALCLGRLRALALLPLVRRLAGLGCAFRALRHRRGRLDRGAKGQLLPL